MRLLRFIIFLSIKVLKDGMRASFLNVMSRFLESSQL